MPPLFHPGALPSDYSPVQLRFIIDSLKVTVDHTIKKLRVLRKELRQLESDDPLYATKSAYIRKLDREKNAMAMEYSMLGIEAEKRIPPTIFSKEG